MEKDEQFLFNFSEQSGTSLYSQKNLKPDMENFRTNDFIWTLLLVNVASQRQFFENELGSLLDVTIGSIGIPECQFIQFPGKGLLWITAQCQMRYWRS